MKSETARAIAPAFATPGRSLSTARAVLRVLSLLLERPAGIRADEVAEDLGKSTSTAYYLLSSLCEEGFAVHASKGVYLPAPGLGEHAVDAPPALVLHEGVSAAVDELFLRTRKRSYLGAVRSETIEIVAFRGRQGVRKMPGLLSGIRDSAHALAMGKVMLALLEPAALERYIARGLRRFTPHTITTGEALKAELVQVGRSGFAVDREEFDEDFCCIAAPVLDRQGSLVATLGLSSTPHVFDTERDSLAEVVMDVARGAAATPAKEPTRRPPPPRFAAREFQADAENTRFLRPATSRPRLGGPAARRP